MPDLAESEFARPVLDIVCREDRFLDFQDKEGIEWIIVASPRECLLECKQPRA